ncbi:hypothetical protein I2F17_07340 [Acinetobacter sp. B10A]|uniref:capsular polysaccharide synthesis protein n=1 Tax=Acinetobacter baretiae TaxID=2605383 RepID=UPI001B3C6A7F|nr:capsular polysaccharide synthesis protein [Acinetobacter baretiae]MBF7685628.1 hypothetical protein [Acinetobacter baretiae]
MINKLFNFILAIYKVFFLLKKEEILIKYIEINNEHKYQNNKKTIPRVIWMFWDGEDIPEIVRLCFASVQKYCDNYEINILNFNTVTQYIDLPTFNNDILMAQRADLVRLELLAKYGGIWIDASIFLTRDLEWIFEKFNDQDAFVFFSDECTTNFNKPITENWFIAAPVKSEFIVAWRDEFKACILSQEPKKYYEEVIKDKSIIQNLTHTEYLLCYISAILCLERKKYNILYASSAQVGHYYNYKFNWNGYALALCLLVRNQNKISKPFLLKITSEMRRPIGVFLKYNFKNRKSLILSVD